MNYNIEINGEKFNSLGTDQIKEIYEICKNDTVLLCKTLPELNGYKFLIKDYQRGYRWVENEIEELLDDINNISSDGDKYCLQPLVVKKCKNEAYESVINGVELINKNGKNDECFELLDGQQRLTTLSIVMNTLKMSNIKYDIFYELYRKIDAEYIKAARDTIEKWFKTHKIELVNPNKGDEKEDFINKLNKIFFVWYEIDKGNPGEIFSNINENKIELTNAELFKALLLNPDNIVDCSDVEDCDLVLERISHEWNSVEESLNNDDFWFFICQKNIEEKDKQSRIDYIIELYARLSKNGNLFDENKDKYSFLVIQKEINDIKANESVFHKITQIWNEILNIYNKLYSWYCDDELYHTIGFISLIDEKDMGSNSIVSNSIFNLYKETMNSEEYIETLKKKAKKQIYLIISENKKLNLCADDVKYDYEKNEKCSKYKNETLRSILLFSNIFYLNYNSIFFKETNVESINSNFISRFPFKIFCNNKWDIEHIAPKQIQKDLSKLKYKDFRNCMEALKIELHYESDDTQPIDIFLDSPETDDSYKRNAHYDECIEMWTDYAEKVISSPDHNIRNLVLLNRKINRDYGNALFSKKRNKIILYDEKNVFIPVCTKNVFLKYYSKNKENLNIWTEADKNDYLEKMKEMMTEIKDWSKYE